MLTEEKPGQLAEKELEARSKNTEALYWAAPCPGPDSSHVVSRPSSGAPSRALLAKLSTGHTGTDRTDTCSVQRRPKHRGPGGSCCDDPKPGLQPLGSKNRVFPSYRLPELPCRVSPQWDKTAKTPQSRPGRRGPTELQPYPSAISCHPQVPQGTW